MSSANKFHQSSQSASSPKSSADDQTNLASQPPSSAENAMDQPLDSTLTAVPPAPPIPSEIMSSTDSSSSSPGSPSIGSTDPTTTDVTTVADNESSKSPSLRQQPIPPASEPMQYRAIGLIRGKYVASEEQFTRGEILTDDGVEIGAVLLGRVMSLVKKHLDLEQSHLWVVYPRTREKGDGNLHVQIVGVWEPENLNRDIDSSDSDLSDLSEEEEDLSHLTDEDSDEDSDELAEAAMSEAAISEATEPTETEAALTEPAPAGVETESIEPDAPEAEATPELEEPIDAESTTSSPASSEKNSEPEADEVLANEDHSATEAEVGSLTAADDLDDRYFSVRGEVIYQSIEEHRLLVKIRRAPRPGIDENKAFKVLLVGALEGKAVGYFWDLHVQREGNMLVVQEGTMIGAVPPQKRGKKPPFSQRRGGSRRPGGPGGPSGPPRKRWQNREGQPRPSRSGGSDRPTPPQNRENRGPSPRPIKRRNLDKPES